MELNGYNLRNLLKKTRRRFSLGAGEQALYQELADICNEENWSQSFQVSNGELTTALNCNEKTLTRWRQSLINAGLIIYDSGKSKRAYGVYSFVTDETTVKNTTNLSTNVSTNLSPNMSTNVSDYYKHKEKQKQKGVFVAPPVGDVVRYFTEKGYSEEIARKAFEYYDVSGWKDSKGRPVRNWKQKMLSVWMKPEHKVDMKREINSEIFEREY